MTYRVRAEARRRRTMQPAKRLRVFGCAHRFARIHWIKADKVGVAFCEGPCRGNLTLALRNARLDLYGRRDLCASFVETLPGPVREINAAGVGVGIAPERAIPPRPLAWEALPALLPPLDFSPFEPESTFTWRYRYAGGAGGFR